MPTSADSNLRWPTWAEADEALRTAWARGYPKETLVSLEAHGEPDAYEKDKLTGETKIDEYGVIRALYIKVTYFRIPAKALVQVGAMQKIYSLAAIFRSEQGGVVFDDIAVGGSTEVAQAGQEAPSKELARQLIAAHFESLNPGLQVQEVKCSDPERKSQASKGRWWYATGADIYTADASGAKKRYSNDMTNLYKGDKGQEGVNPSGDWKVHFVDKPMPK